MTNSFNAAFDALAQTAFIGVGLADPATYLPPGAADDAVPIACTVMVDRDVASLGEFNQVTGSHVEVTMFLAEVQPQRGGVLTLDDGTYVLEQPVAGAQDESRSRWVVSQDVP